MIKHEIIKKDFKEIIVIKEPYLKITPCNKFQVGKKFTNKYNDEIEILGKVANNFYHVVYTNGHEAFLSGSHITRMEFKNPYYKNICNGIACIGNPVIDDKEFKNKLYTRWLNMIKRCYDTTNNSYKSYGAKGVTVSDRWKCFEYYLEDVQLIPGYNKQLIINNDIQLDKDILSGDKKIYSKETCLWISKTYNSSISDSNDGLKKARSIRQIHYSMTDMNGNIVEEDITTDKIVKKYFNNITRPTLSKRLAILKKNDFKDPYKGYYFNIINLRKE